MNRIQTFSLRATAASLAIVACGALASSAAATPKAAPAGVRLQPAKSYLLKHTALLAGFTRDFLAQAAALAFVLGSYAAAETLRGRRRARILTGPALPARPEG